MTHQQLISFPLKYNLTHITHLGKFLKFRSRSYANESYANESYAKSY